MEFAVPQKRLGPRSFFVAALLIDLLQILAFDMYTPALPSMVDELQVSASYLNLTVFAYLLVSALFMIISGPISDKFGRKPPLVAGCVLFAVASVGCALAPGVNALIAWRCVQAVGYGCVATICSALMKDAYTGESLKLAMTLMQSLVIIGPLMAPFLGSFMISIMHWRGVFWFLAAAGIVTIGCSLLISETLPREGQAEEGLAALLASMVRQSVGLLRKPGFGSLSLYMALAGMPMMAFVGIASYILISEFGVGYLEYSLLYAGMTIVNIIAPYVYLALSKKLNMGAIAVLCCGLYAISAVLLFTLGTVNPVLFLVAFAPHALAEGIVRPAAFVVLLDQPPHLVGTASAFANFFYSVMSSVATVLVTLPSPSFLFALSVLMAACTAGMAALTAGGRRAWN